MNPLKSIDFLRGTLFKNDTEQRDFNFSLDEAAKKKLSDLIHLDPHAPEGIKEKLLSFLDGPDPLGHLFAGAAGAATAYTVAKLLNLKPKTQILLSLAGFGAGVILGASIGHPQHLKQENGKTTFMVD